MKYRVYIKPAATNLLIDQKISILYGCLQGFNNDPKIIHDLPKENIPQGKFILYNTPSAAPSYSPYVTTEMKLPGTSGNKPTIQLVTDFIEVDQNKYYRLKEARQPNDPIYTIYGYDQNKNIIANTAQNFVPDEYYYSSDKYYYPSQKSQNIKYIRIIIRAEKGKDYDSNYFPKTSTTTDKNMKNARISSFMFLEYSKDDAVMIHDSGSPEITDHLINPTLELSDSSPGNFSFTIYKTHKYYDKKINLWTDTIYITRTYKTGENIIWDGRPITSDMDSNGNIAYYCEGALAYFNDLRVISNASISGFTGTVKEFVNTYILDYQDSIWLNYRMDRTCSWYYYPQSRRSVIDVDGNNKVLWMTDDRRSALKWLNDIVESYGAHMKIRYSDAGFDLTINQPISRSFIMVQDLDSIVKTSETKVINEIHTIFGQDVFDAKKTLEIEDVVTCVIPRGMKVDPTQEDIDNYIYLDTSHAKIDGQNKTFKTYYSYNKIEDGDLERKYGYVEAVVDFENADSPKQLKKEVDLWFKNFKKDIIKTNIEMTLCDFGQIEFSRPSLGGYTDPEYIDIWTAVYAIIPELGIYEEELFYVVSLSIPLDDHLNTRVTLSHNSKMISDNIISAGDIKGTSNGIINK